MRTIVIVLLTAAAVSGNAYADGRVYWRDRTGGGMPYQRALLMFHEGNETLVLQSAFWAGGLDTAAVVGWVVPAPSVPELASMKADEGGRLFAALGRKSATRVVHLSQLTLGFLLPVLVLLIIVAGVIIDVSAGKPEAASAHARAERVFERALCLAVLLVLLSMSIPEFSGGSSRDRSEVDVVSSERVGIYDAHVIRSESSAAVMRWLDERGFEYGSADRSALDRYVAAGWCFVVAQVDTKEQMRGKYDHGALIDPLVLRFASSAPVYPMALTATAGSPTDLLLYVLSDRRMDGPAGLTLKFAGSFRHGFGEFLPASLPGTFRDWEGDLTHLSKFRAILAPAEMQSDLVFEASRRNRSHREVIVTFW